ncbi:MAG: hypothetical protein LUD68_01335 [Rikenellaceae bacterium]|nr:hypothetical protein [Rikenellaceae bacterium]
MFKIIYIREIQHWLHSLRFKVSFTIVLAVFIIGTISFIVTTKQERTNYN